MIDATIDRFHELCDSLIEAADRRESLEHVEVTSQGSGACVIRLTSPRGPFSLLDVSPRGVTVTTHSNGVHPEAGESTIVDRLGVDLTSSYTWDDATFDSAEELADALLKHMLRRVKETDPAPPEVAD